MNLGEFVVRPVRPFEEQRYINLMQEHHYLGSLPKIGETLWYAASLHDEWTALLSFSAAALKCAARDRWIGWNFRRTQKGYAPTESSKMVFVKPLEPNAQALLSRAILEPSYRTGGPGIMLSADRMQSLPSFFADIPAVGRHHTLL